MKISIFAKWSEGKPGRQLSPAEALANPSLIGAVNASQSTLDEEHVSEKAFMERVNTKFGIAGVLGEPNRDNPRSVAFYKRNVSVRVSTAIVHDVEL